MPDDEKASPPVRLPPPIAPKPPLAESTDLDDLWNEDGTIR